MVAWTFLPTKSVTPAQPRAYGAPSKYNIPTASELLYKS